MAACDCCHADIERYRTAANADHAESIRFYTTRLGLVLEFGGTATLSATELGLRNPQVATDLASEFVVDLGVAGHS